MTRLSLVLGLLFGCDMPPCGQPPGDAAVEALLGRTLTSVETYEGYCIYSDARSRAVATSTYYPHAGAACEGAEEIGRARVRSVDAARTELVLRYGDECTVVTVYGPRASLSDAAIHRFAAIGAGRASRRSR